MAHRTGTSDYRKLTARLNKFPQGAPPSELLYRILSLLMTEQEAGLMAELPLRPFTVEAAARAWRVAPAEARRQLDRLADRALLLDSEFEGERLYLFPPPMTGFFEFSMMRVRPDVDQTTLSELLYTYINVEDEFVTALFGTADTKIGRALVHGPVLQEMLSGDGDGDGDGDGADRSRDGAVHQGGDGRGEGAGASAGGAGLAADGDGGMRADTLTVLDHERADELIRAARHRAVGTCSCRHKMHHVGNACDAPLETCMSFDFVADSLIRHGHARPFDVAEGLELLAQAEEACLLQFAENVRRSPKFLCHCCSCCCDALVAARRFGFLHPVETTNFLPVVSAAECRACGKCVDACPVGAVRLGDEGLSVDEPVAPAVAETGARVVGETDTRSPGGTVARAAGTGAVRGMDVAIVDLERCLGCGICVRVCPYGAVVLEPREERVLTPVNSTQRLVSQAIETGTLPYLVFDEQSRSGHRALAAVMGAVAKLPPFKQALASRQLKSRYLERLCDRREWDY